MSSPMYNFSIAGLQKSAFNEFPEPPNVPLIKHAVRGELLCRRTSMSRLQRRQTRREGGRRHPSKAYLPSPAFDGARRFAGEPSGRHRVATHG
jgi:hypothetical protein